MTFTVFRTLPASDIHEEPTAGHELMQRHNAAGRVLALVEKMRTLPGNPPIPEGWAKTFGVEEAHPIRRTHAVARYVELSLDQLEILRTELAERRINPVTYEQHLQAVEGTLALQVHGGEWKSIRGRFTPEVMAVLQMLPEWLPESEPRISDEQLQAVLEQVTYWEQAVRAGGLPDPTKAFLLHQLGLIRRAAREYAISGALAFRTAANDAAMEWVNSADVIEPYCDADEVRAVRDLWDEIQRCAKSVIILWGLTKFILLDAPAALQRMRELHIIPPAQEQTTRRLPPPPVVPHRPEEPDFEVVEDDE